MRLRAVLALAALSGALVSTSAGAATPTHTWTFHGSGVRSVVLRLDAPVTLELARAVEGANERSRALSSVVALSGRYGGVLIRDRNRVVRAAVARYAPSPSLVTWGTYDDANRQRLEAGTYTVTVFGDRTVRVSLPVQADRTRSLIATRPASARITERHDADQTAGTLPVADLSSPMTLRPRGSYLVLSWMASPLPSVGASALCLALPENRTCVGATQQSIGPEGCVACVGRNTTLALFGDTGWIPAGQYVARYTVAHSATSSGHALLSAVFD